MGPHAVRRRPNMLALQWPAACRTPETEKPPVGPIPLATGMSLPEERTRSADGPQSGRREWTRTIDPHHVKVVL